MIRPMKESSVSAGAAPAAGRAWLYHYNDTESNIEVPICNATQEPGDDDCIRPLTIPFDWLLYPVYGIFSPIIVAFTIVTNSLIVVVLMRPHMRSATNVLLVAMALSDMLTGMWPLPIYVNFYSLGRANDYVPYNWCFVYHCLIEYLPIVCHTASIWLTVALAVQRYICVCHSIAAKKLCTVTNVIKAIVAVYVAAFISQLTRFVELRYTPIHLLSLLHPSQPIDSSNDDDPSYAVVGGTVVPLTTTTAAGDAAATTAAAVTEADVVIGCAETYAGFVADYTHEYFSVYYWFRVIFIHLIPCTTLIIFNALLVHALRAAQRRRCQLLAQNRKSECRRLAESNMTTLMLVAVVGVFLLAEIPLAVAMIALIVDNTWNLELVDEYVKWIVPLLLNMFVLLSYPLNFFIYCGMSRQFRDTFKSLCCTTSSTAGDAQAAHCAERTTIYVAVGTKDASRDGERATSTI